MTSLIIPDGFPVETATELAIANGCAGYYTGIPPKWVVISGEQGWTLPCVVETDEYDAVLSWSPVA
jgi:hypothetical protein